MDLRDCPREFFILVLLGVVLFGLGIFLDWVAALATGMPWAGALACQDGSHYYVRPDAPPGPAQGEFLVPVTRERFERRFHIQILSGFVASAGVLALLAAFVLFLATLLVKHFPSQLPRGPASRVVLGIYSVAVALLFVVAILADVMGERFAGLKFASHIYERGGRYFAERRGGRPETKVLVPVSEQQYRVWNEGTIISRRLALAGGLAFFPLWLFFVVQCLRNRKR